MSTPDKRLPADYGDATPEQVAKAVLLYRPDDTPSDDEESSQ